MLGLSSAFVAGHALADRGHYLGAHPIADDHAGTFCYIDASHTHTYTPSSEQADSAYVSQELGGITQLEFVGDPMSRGYEGPLIAYGEAHPVQLKGGEDSTNTICELEGAHFHLHEPSDASQFELRKGTYYFESYKFAMEEKRERRMLEAATIREQRKLEVAAERERKAEERTQLKEERRLEREAKRAERDANGESPQSRRKSSTRKVASSKTASSSTRNRPAAKKSVKKKTKKKPKKKAFRSWMSRRRGR